jgi:hypothetical protein
MADIFYVPPKQRTNECRYLEKNYLACIFQKALKDRVSNSFCDLQGVIYFHIECPNYIERFEGPEAKSYIKRSIFSMLLLPYYHGKNFAYNSALSHFSKGQKDQMSRYIPYPEEYNTSFNYDKSADLGNPELFRRHKEFYTSSTNYYNMNVGVNLDGKLPGKLAEPEA